MPRTAGTTGSTDPGCPADVSETLHSFIIELSHAAKDTDRQRLKPYHDRIIGTGSQPDADKRAAYMCVDWIVRVHTPAFLRLAGLGQHADALARADEIVDIETTDRVAARIKDAEAAASAAVDTVVDAAADSTTGSAAASATAHRAADAAARSAGRSGRLGSTAPDRLSGWSAVRAAAESAVRTTAYSAAYSATWSAAFSAAHTAVTDPSADTAAAQERFAATVTAMDASAVGLLDRMIAVYRRPVA